MGMNPSRPSQHRRPREQRAEKLWPERVSRGLLMRRASTLLLVGLCAALASGIGLEQVSSGPNSSPEATRIPREDFDVKSLTHVGAAICEPRINLSNEPGSEGQQHSLALTKLEASKLPACPPDMLLVEGAYCSEVEHTCKRWMDDPRLAYARCGEYEKTARCMGQRLKMRYCVDRYEYTAPGNELPKNYSSFSTSSKICRKLGKRLCSESEWNFACEGEEMRPYPYGFSREAKCNQDRADLYVRTPKKLLLKDLRAPAGAHSECVSPFGVYDMVGNLDEPVLREVARYNHPFRNALKGGWWMSGRNRCRPATTAHDDYYEDVQVGVRCCADARGDEPRPTG